MKTIKRIMLMMLSAVMTIGIVPTQAVAAVTHTSGTTDMTVTYTHETATPAMTMEKKDLVMNYPYPAGFYRPTVYTGEYTYWVSVKQTPDSGSKYGFRTPKDEAAYKATINSPLSTSDVTRELQATGHMAAAYVSCKIAYTTDETRDALSRGMTYIPAKANASNMGKDFGRDDDVIRNLVVCTTKTQVMNYTGTNAFRNSALETILFDAGWDSEGVYTFADTKTGSSYDWTWAETNGLVFGREAIIIEDGAFSDCPNLVTVWFEHEPARLYLAPTVFANCPKLTVHAPSGGVIEAHCRANGIKFESTDTQAVTQVTQPVTPEPPIQPGGDAKLPDMPANAWYVPAVTWAYENSLVTGDAAKLFVPNSACSRAMVVDILYSQSGRPDAAGLTNPFTDVPDTAWYAPAVKWAAANGVVNGLGGGKFGPDGNLTRGQIVQILYNLAGKPSAAGLTNPFTDVSDTAWYTPAVKWAAADGVVSGIGGSMFAPENACTCAQIVQILYNMR